MAVTVQDGAALSLQKAVFARVAASAEMKTLIGDPVRLYDRVPRNNPWPGDYISFGAHGEDDDSAICAPGVIYEGEEHSLTMHVWSRSVSGPDLGATQAKKIAAALRRCLSNQEIAPDGHHLLHLTHASTNTFADPDGLTTHTVVVFSAQTESSL